MWRGKITSSRRLGAESRQEWEVDEEGREKWSGTGNLSVPCRYSWKGRG